MATVTEPLHKLLRKDVHWQWGGDCEVAFSRIKEMLCNAPLLMHFDPSRPIVVHCDASPYGLGVVLSHITVDGKERPVSYASRTLSVAERNYAHVEKEGLALVFAVRKFHQFLYGIKFALFTDHKPLLGLFSEKAELPVRAAARVLRWALLLSAYNYTLEYRPGSGNANADGLSRLPLDARNGEVSQVVSSVCMMELVKAPVTQSDLRRATRTDPVLGVVLNKILEGWGAQAAASDDLWPYHQRSSELSTEGGCILWGSRLVIPKSLRGKVMLELHDVHTGVCRMKSLARSYVWWPGVDKEIEEVVHQCAMCQINQINAMGENTHRPCWACARKNVFDSGG